MQGIQEAFRQVLNLKEEELSISPVGGGSINEAFKISCQTGSFFCKRNRANSFPRMFEKEARGLEMLAHSSSFRVPKVYGSTEVNNMSYLILEFIDKGTTTPSSADTFAEALVNLHAHTTESFGLEYDNYIGSLVQTNHQYTNWPAFFIEQRIEPLLKRLADQQTMDSTFLKDWEKLGSHLDDFFPETKPSLLHGDLWSGNYMIDEHEQAVIFDPAVYYGHPYMDLGMMQLFGGFDAHIFSAYAERVSLPSNWQEGTEVANLYPLLVHAVLFGQSYLHSVKSIIQRYA